MELFTKIFNGFQLSTIFEKNLHLMFDRVLNTTLQFVDLCCNSATKKLSQTLKTLLWSVFKIRWVNLEKIFTRNTLINLKSNYIHFNVNRRSLRWITKILFLNKEAVIQRCSVRKLFLETSQNSQENTCARVSFLIKLQAGLQLY